MNLLDYITETLRRSRDVAVEDLPKIAEEVSGAVDATIKGAINTESAHREARMQALSMVLAHRKGEFPATESVVEEAGVFAAFIAFGAIPAQPPVVVVEGPAESAPVSLGLDEVPADGDIVTAGEGAA